MKKINGNEIRPEWQRIGLGMGVSCVLAVVMTALGAWLLEREIIGMEWMNYLAALTLLVSSFAGGKMSGSSVNTWVNPLLAGVGFWGVLVAIHTLIFGGSLSGAPETALVILGGCGSSLLTGGGGKRRSKRRRGYRNR